MTDNPRNNGTQHSETNEGTASTVAILGAGPAGLAAGHYLSSQGVRVHTLELKDRVGGLCITIEKDGFLFDLGGHRWFTKNMELHNWFLKLMEGHLVTVQRTSRIYFAGKYYNYPISPKNVIRNAGLFTSGLAMLSYLKEAAKDMVSSKPPKNLREAFTMQFGARIYEMFFRRYSEKVWGRSCDEISADWSSQRSKGLSILTALKEAVLKKNDVVSLVDEFVYPRYGYQRICDRMAEDMANEGNPVWLSSPLKKLIYNGPYDFTCVHDSPEGEQRTRADNVISTIPITHLVKMMEPACPESVTRAADSLDFRDLITVTVMLEKEQVTPDTWLYIHDEDLIFARMHEPKNWSPNMVPGPEYTSVVCECFCSRKDPIWQMKDEEIAKRVVDDMADKLEFIDHDEVIDTVVVRTVNTYPVYDLEYKDKLAVIYDYINEHEGLHIVGRGGTFRYNNADHSVEMGQLLAKRLMGEAADHMSVNTEQDYHEEIKLSLANAAKQAKAGYQIRRATPANK